VTVWWHGRQVSIGFFASRAISSEEWGTWQARHLPEATGAWAVFLLNPALSWQVKQRSGIFDTINLAFFDEWGLWQLVQPMLIAGCTSFLVNTALS
jgi:hypothetical protein